MSSKFDIHQLAAEIVQGIGALLPIGDAGNLRLTCKRFNEMLESVVLQELTLNINNANLAKSIPKLRALAAGRSPSAARATTRLVLVWFCPSYDPVTMLSKNDAEVAQGERRMKKYLSDAIIALKQVNTVSWFTRDLDEIWVQTTIMKALKGLPQLQNLTLDATFLKVAPALQRLQSLQEIYITMAQNDFVEDTCANVAKLLARNSYITKIHICPDERNYRPSLHALLSDCSPDVPCRIQSLALKNFLVKFDATTLPHLGHLKSLDLSCILYPQPVTSKGDEFAFQSEFNVGSTPNEIWDALLHSGIHLEEVFLTQLTATFLAYIESYSGLRKIVLSTSGIATEATDQHASRFWSVSLQQHRHTLQTLRVEAEREGPWCFGDPILPSVIKCVALRDISVSLSPEGLTSYHDPSDPESIVTRLLDHIACYLPHVKYLTLLPTVVPIYSSKKPIDRINDISRAQALITAQVQGYIAPPSCRELPEVAITSLNGRLEMYVPTRASANEAKLEPGEWYFERALAGQE